MHLRRVAKNIQMESNKSARMHAAGEEEEAGGGQMLLTFLPISPVHHGCQMAIAGFLDRMCLALRASGLWLRYAALQNLIPSFPWIAPPRPPPWRNPRKGRDQILPSGNLVQEQRRRQAHPRPHRLLRIVVRREVRRRRSLFRAEQEWRKIGQNLICNR